MGIQQIIVMIVALGCIAYAIYRIVQYFRDINNNKNPCEGCTSDCALRNLKKDCSPKRKNCCH